MADSEFEEDSLIQVGNAEDDSSETRGWFVGNFLDESAGFRKSPDIELKWGKHEAGARRKEWVTGEFRTTVAILISGKFEMEFRNKAVVLDKPGDYVMWGRGIDHRWHSIEASTVITVRWPSSVDH